MVKIWELNEGGNMIEEVPSYYEVILLGPLVRLAKKMIMLPLISHKSWKWKDTAETLKSYS